MQKSSATISIVVVYGVALAGVAVLLQWLEYQYFLKAYPTEIYIVIIAIVFASLGVWIGMRLARKHGSESFERNDAAIASLGLTAREFEVLEHLAKGQSNKEIARNLDISPNTIKTHIAQVFHKLGVQSRAKAVETSRSLHFVP